MKPYNIYVAYVAWNGDGKRRPVLVLSSNQKEVSVFKITSKYEDKSAVIQSQYFCIEDWKEAGLLKQSYIDTGSTINLPLSNMLAAPIGKLSKNDMKKLITVINR